MIPDNSIFGKNFLSLCTELMELSYNMVVSFGEYDFETEVINAPIEVTFQSGEEDDLDIVGEYTIYPMQTIRGTYILAPEDSRVTLDELLAEFEKTVKGDDA